MELTSSKIISNFIWINGNFVEKSEANIDLLTHSLHYGGAVFEGERSYNGKIFKLDEHTDRLIESAKLMHIDINWSRDEINEATIATLKKNNLKNAYIRPLIWRSSNSLMAYNNSLKSNLMIMAMESNPAFKNDLKLFLSPWKKISANSMPAQSKSSAHYAMATISKKIAQDYGCSDALLLDEFDNIAECSTSNIFFGNDKELVTPIADRFLNGITRKTIIEIAKSCGISVKEKRLTINDICKYNSCFTTGTSAEIKGVISISTENEIINFPNNKITIALQEKYKEITGKTT